MLSKHQLLITSYIFEQLLKEATTSVYSATTKWKFILPYVQTPTCTSEDLQSSLAPPFLLVAQAPTCFTNYQDKICFLLQIQPVKTNSVKPLCQILILFN